jgi:hypothetical protein
MGSRGDPTGDPIPDPPAPCEPHAEPPLLRGDGGVLGGSRSDADAGDSAASGVTTVPKPDRVQAIVAQLLPIESRSALMSSFEREANPNDEFVRRAYECVWADLVLGVARTGTRRARIRATTAQARGAALRGRG